jgi:hypothetical protein
MRQDRFLTGILIFIGLLVVLAVSLFFFRQRSEQTYGPDDTPVGVVRNYVLALQKADYERAYSYVAANTLQASQAQFRQSLTNNARDISDTAIQIGAAQQSSTGEATVSLDIVQNQGGLFSNVNHQSQTAALVRQNGAWKIQTMPYPFWSYDFPQGPAIKAEPTS